MAVEQRRGPLFHCLSQCLDWLDLYPINPQSLARYRQAFYTSRAKGDPIDSQLLEDLLRSHPERTTPWSTIPLRVRQVLQKGIRKEWRIGWVLEK